ncbi:hypothetical protein HKX48_005734 [Thoreauomyces humboldtii]|nr:hypothetical protein HKX48_005734 [Thoreauomyces humboldtii]
MSPAKQTSAGKAKAKVPKTAADVPLQMPSPSVSKNAPLIDLDEEEQWRIVNETGLLHKLKADATAANVRPGTISSFADDEPVFVAIFLAIPLTMLHGLLEFMVHEQYAFTERFTASHVLRRQVPLAPAIGLLAYATGRLKGHLAAQIAFLVASAAAGCALIAFTSNEPTFGEMLNTPGLAVLWILLVIQMRLSFAVPSLLVPLAYHFRHHFEGSNIRGGFDT